MNSSNNSVANNNNNNTEQIVNNTPIAVGRSNISQIVDGILNSDLNDIINISTRNSNTNSIMYSNNPHGHSHVGLYDQQNTNGHMIMNSALSNSDQVVLNLLSNNSNSNQSENNGSMTNRTDQIDNQHQHSHQQQDMNGSNNFFLLALKTLQSSLPFFVILIAKIFHQHLLGFFVVLGFMTTLHWSNKTLVKQVEFKDKKENHKLILLIVFLMLNVGIFFIIFRDYKLENCLIFLSTNIQKMDTWNLIWIVVCSDTIIKFFVISIKAFITLLPFNIVPLRKRGNFYSTVETFALFYRCLTPIHPWILFIMHSDASLKLVEDIVASSSELSKLDQTAKHIDAKESTFFPIMLCILYTIFKINQIYNCFNELSQSTRELFLDMTYGIPVTLNEQDENICPICQDKYTNPVILKCKHTFCQDCVCVWLDKENSCPMCRARISVKKPKYKDGSTSIFVQWF